ncbi:MAG: hypothetical protein ABII74_08700 [Elusimicrobiota bacterium]
MLKFIEFYKIITTVLMFGLGVVIVYRSIIHWYSIMILILGISLIGFGLYRLALIVHYFQERKLDRGK